VTLYWNRLYYRVNIVTYIYNDIPEIVYCWKDQCSVMIERQVLFTSKYTCNIPTCIQDLDSLIHVYIKTQRKDILIYTCIWTGFMIKSFFHKILVNKIRNGWLTKCNLTNDLGGQVTFVYCKLKDHENEIYMYFVQVGHRPSNERQSLKWGTFFPL